jgi:hypothetical protein
MDSQLVELAGRNWLTYQLLSAGLEVARPERDRGIDLIAYLDIDETVGEFVACPIQMKASTNRDFSIYSKYGKFPRLILAYVWHIGEPNQTISYALTSGEAFQIAERKGYTKSPTWQDEGRYNNTKPGEEVLQLMEPYKMTPTRWRSKILECLRDVSRDGETCRASSAEALPPIGSKL